MHSENFDSVLFKDVVTTTPIFITHNHDLSISINSEQNPPPEWKLCFGKGSDDG